MGFILGLIVGFLFCRVPLLSGLLVQFVRKIVAFIRSILRV